jgi:hypothetical protein
MPLKLDPMYAFRWDGAGCLRALEEMLGFVYECGQRWDEIAWKQTASVKYAAINSEQPEKEAEDVDSARHDD